MEGKGEEQAAEGEEGGEWEDVDEGKQEQKVYVLDQGFVGWARVYGTDERLTTAYSKDIWEDY